MLVLEHPALGRGAILAAWRRYADETRTRGLIMSTHRRAGDRTQQTLWRLPPISVQVEGRSSSTATSCCCSACRAGRTRPGEADLRTARRTEVAAEQLRHPMRHVAWRLLGADVQRRKASRRAAEQCGLVRPSAGRCGKLRTARLGRPWSHARFPRRRSAAARIR